MAHPVVVQVWCVHAHHGELEGDGGYDAGHDEDDAPDDRVAELDLGEVGEAGLDALRHVADVHQQEEARDEEGRPGVQFNRHLGFRVGFRDKFRVNFSTRELQ